MSAALAGRRTGRAGPAVRRTGRAARAVQARGLPAGTRRRNADRRTELDEGLAQRRQGENHADGEYGAGSRQDRPEQPVPPVPRPLPGTAAASRAAASLFLPASSGRPASKVGQESARRHVPAGAGGPGPHPRADPLESVRMRFDLVRGGMQRPAQVLPEVHRVGSLRRGAVESGSGHYSRSRAARRAVMPRAVWLLTAPRLIPIAAAISASDRSA
jgi:hypothetical protein